METVEFIVYLGVAILVGTLMIGMLTGWDFTREYKTIHTMMADDVPEDFHLDLDEFAGRLQTIFNDCEGINTNTTFYIQDNGTIGKAELFAFYKSLDWCDTIQSKSEGCGSREDVVMSPIAAPKVVRVECTNHVLYIS